MGRHFDNNLTRLVCWCHQNRHGAFCPSSIEIPGISLSSRILGLATRSGTGGGMSLSLIASFFRHLHFVPVLDRMFCPSQSELLGRSRDWKTDTVKHHYRDVSRTNSPFSWYLDRCLHFLAPW